MTKTNEDIYRTMGKPLVRKVLEGFNAVLIAYGQTGSGKTHTLVGKPEQNVMGVLPFMLKELYNSETVKKLSVSGCEAYGTHVSRIELFDVFREENLNKDWTKKKGQGGLEPKKCTSKVINELEECWGLINDAHDASHFAPTGKNPESSRGHVAFVTKVEQENPSDGTLMTSYLVVVDLAGSEGESAFTPEFVKKVDPPTLMARRLEAGCINTGLSQLQVVFNELKVKGKLTKSRGTGLRRILHAYINSNCTISVMFTLSPAYTNRITTESTLKFAVQAGMVKVKPVKAKAKVNYKTLVAELQKHVKEQEELIEKLNDDIEKINDKNADLELKVKQLTAKVDAIGNNENDQKENGKNDDEDKDAKPTTGLLQASVSWNEEEIEQSRRKMQRKSGFKRQMTQMSDTLAKSLAHLEEFDENDEYHEDGYIQLSLADQQSHVAHDISATKVDNEIKRVHSIRKTMNIDATMLNEVISKATTSMKKLNVDAAADNGDQKENDENKVEDTKKETKVMETPTPKQYFEDDENASKAPSYQHIDEADAWLKQRNMNRFNNAQNNDEEEDEEDEGDADFLQFQTQDTAGMEKNELVDYCDELESKLIEEKTLRYGLQKSQQVIIDHLMETNEALLQWFKVKKIL